MTPEEWHKIKEILQTVIELDPDARENFLDSACAGQSSMRSEVESLLQSHEQNKNFLEQPVAIDAADVVSSTASAAWIGRRVGPYELLEEIGEGGMGAVYRAVRADGMYDKQVAVKLIRSGLSTDYFVSRFKTNVKFSQHLSIPTSRASSTVESRKTGCHLSCWNLSLVCRLTNSALFTTCP